MLLLIKKSVETNMASKEVMVWNDELGLDYIFSEAVNLTEISW